jgi:hypothetical protein
MSPEHGRCNAAFGDMQAQSVPQSGLRCRMARMMIKRPDQISVEAL